ncbi:MAG: NifB/NifX family molybdenum-iron cluster-binding protein [Eubacteriales bacterium]|uniref:Putative Fe-Mo cluster-binding NifX family protein n=1 Tax=Aminicella lysinilytica TaxID=433323 RepID=A0A4R6Q193_9FIRM|nr:NifB/NifX family molybdenum-iron cluster-binding protein [Aminicella lysinilytica]MDD4377287.1 NifB/NifX family molybdenum-iron cluster-binding protein [Eubacteriales bacterium]TDP55954.1 putative Fe-Mo cluster-binding NifX family protein [Aminicella lysinilytica]
MKIIIPVNEDKGTVCVSFGRTPLFLMVDLETKEREFIVNPAADAAGGAGTKAAQLIVDKKADAVLTPRCGQNAAIVLDAAEIKIYKTTSEDVEKEIEKFNQGKLEILSEIHEGFHNHGFSK